MVLRRVSAQQQSAARSHSGGSGGGSDDGSLQIAFMSQQQLHSFNRPYQLG